MDEVQVKSFPAATILEANLPLEVVDQINKHIDEGRSTAKDYSPYLAGEIRQGEYSAELELDGAEEVPARLITILHELCKVYLKDMNLWGPDAEVNPEVDSMWTVHSYSGDYNPPHEHFVPTITGVSCILYLKTPDQIKPSHVQGNPDGHTRLSWGDYDSSQDLQMLRPWQATYYYPEVGKLIMFPVWMKHSVNPFYGDGERRTLSANIKINEEGDRRKEYQELKGFVGGRHE